MKRTGICLLICLAILLILGTTACAEGQESKAITVMVYLCGSDLESVHGAATADFQEMRSSGFDPETTNVLVMTGGAKRWFAGFPSTQTTIYRFAKSLLTDGLAEYPTAVGERSMGDAETLRFFLDYCRENYPADRYALILWDHGGDPMEGLCYDEMFGRDRLSLEELAKALEESSFGPEEPLEWIGFDACLMSSLETAEICSGSAHYMIASQETEPAKGWDYSFLRELGSGITGAEVGTIVTDAFLKNGNPEHMLTLSCTDLSQVGPLRQSADALFTALTEQLTARSFSLISNLRMETKSYGDTTLCSAYDLVDLFHLSEQFSTLIPAEAKAVQEAVERAVVCNRTNQANSHGLSLYSPYYNKDAYTGKWAESYQNMAYSAPYSGFMSRYAAIWLGERLVDWSHLLGSALPMENGTQTVELALNEEQLEQFSSAKVLVLQATGENDGYLKIFESQAIAPEGSTLRFNYDFSAWFVVDENGEPLTGELPVETWKGYVTIPVYLRNESRYRRGDEHDYRYATLLYRPGEADRLELQDVIVSQQDADESQLNLGRQGENPLEDWKVVDFHTYYSQQPVRDEDGSLLPYACWPQAGALYQNDSIVSPDGERYSPTDVRNFYSVEELDEDAFHYFGETSPEQAKELRRVQRQFSGFGLYAQFVVTDTQGYESASELIPLYNPALASSTPVNQTFWTADGVNVELTHIDVIRSDYNPGVYFFFSGINETDERIRIGLGELVFNTAYLRVYGMDSLSLWPHSSMKSYLYVSQLGTAVLRNPLIRQIRYSPRVTIYSEGEKTDTMQGERQELPLELDVSALKDEEEKLRGGVLSEADAVIVFRLLTLEADETGELHGRLQLLNRRAKTYTVCFTPAEGESTGIFLNSCYLPDCVELPHSVVLSENESREIPFVIHMGENTVRRAANWGLTQIEELSIPFLWSSKMEPEELASFWNKTKQLACLTLSEAIKLPMPNEESSLRQKPILKLPDCEWQLESVSWSDGQLHLSINVEYTIHEDYLLAFGASCSVDGVLVESEWQTDLARADSGLLAFDYTLPQYTEKQLHERIELDMTSPSAFEEIELLLYCTVDAEHDAIYSLYLQPKKPVGEYDFPLHGDELYLYFELEKLIED